MKRIFYAAIMTLIVSGCSQPDKKETTNSNKGDDMKAMYEANLATYKSQIAAFEKEDLNGWASSIADDAVWSSPVYGDTIKTKAHWVESIKNIMDSNSNLHLTDAQFLPGVDSATQQPDGSVRYYGTWHATPASGKELSIKFYGTYDFTNDHKIISGDEFYDVGGVMNAAKADK
jgi:ketosteroid isomerase-like protein